MRRLLISILTFITACLIVGCDSDKATTGSDILPADDQIVVLVDTFTLVSDLDSMGHIFSQPDSFLLGEIETSYGTLRADILTQLAAPLGFVYPANAEMDSVCLYAYYSTITGDNVSPLAIRVYEMDKATLDYDRRYYSNIAVEDYCSFSDSTNIVEHAALITAAEYRDSIYHKSKYIPGVKMKLTERFAKRFFEQNKRFTTQEEFNKLFKGLYITTDFGSATILNVNTIVMAVYYHFYYDKYNPATGEHESVREKDVKTFYANAEVKQVNRYTYLNQDALIEQLIQTMDVYNYVISPAGVYTQIKFPIADILSEIETNIKGFTDKRNTYINMASLKMNVVYNPNKTSTDKTPEDWLLPAPHMLLVNDSIRETYFVDKWLSVLTEDAVLGTLTSGTDSLGNTIYYYSFDVSKMLMEKLRMAEYDLEDADDVLSMSLVPVSVSYATSSSTGSTTGQTITAIKQYQVPSATIFYSPNNPQTPLILEIVYSGF